MKIALFSRSIYPRKGGSSFVTEQLAGNFSSEELFVIGGKDIFLSPTKQRPPNSPRFYYLPSQISIRGRGERFFEFFRYLLFPINLVQSVLIIRKERPDAVVCVFPDAYFCWLGLICSRLMKKTYFTYFHNTYKENRTGLDLWMADKIQHKFFSASRLIFVMSDGLKRFYERTYPSIRKFKTLPHTFREWPEKINGGEPGRSIHEFNLAFTGNFNDSNMESTTRVVNALKKYPYIRMNFYTPVPKTLLKLRGLDVNAINYVGYLPDKDYRRMLSKNDVMILTHGFTGGYSAVEYETIFPTRTIELLLTDKPIFAHAPKTSFLAEYLVTNDCAVVVTDADEELIRRELLTFLQDNHLGEKKVKNGRQCLISFYGPVVVENWKGQIQEAMR
jgi:hypothetical protein